MPGDPFRTAPDQPLPREARVGLAVLIVILTVFVWVAWHRITMTTPLPEHVRNAPISRQVWPNGGPAEREQSRSLGDNLSDLMSSARDHLVSGFPGSPDRMPVDPEPTNPPRRPDAFQSPHDSMPLRLPTVDSGTTSALAGIETEISNEPVLPRDRGTVAANYNQPADSSDNEFPIANLNQQGSMNDPIVVGPLAVSAGFAPQPLRPVVESTTQLTPQHQSGLPVPSGAFLPVASGAPVVESGSFVLPQPLPVAGDTNPIAEEMAGNELAGNELDRPQPASGPLVVSPPSPGGAFPANGLRGSEQPSVPETFTRSTPLPQSLIPSATNGAMEDAVTPLRNTADLIRTDAQTGGEDRVRAAGIDTIGQPDPVPPGFYRIATGDSFYSVAQQKYNDGRLFRALFEHNRRMVNSFENPGTGRTISVPPVQELLRLWPELVPADILGGNESEAASRIYRTVNGDTLFEIARQQLGQASRYLEIMKINDVRLPAGTGHLSELPAGTELILPLSGS